ncbi:MAG: hypothetical protein U5N55_11520 [Cypionkella sp.]|nr:hypothetical protein [Cypionkella sp.]
MAFVGATALLGAYLVSLGGYVMLPLGALILVACLPMALMAYRRLRFAQAGIGEGVIEVVEGELRYFAPPAPQIIGAVPLPSLQMGGYLNLPDLAQLQLIHRDHRRFWRMKTTGGQALIVPVDAAGHEALFDVFAALPRIDSAALITALSRGPVTGSGAQTLWRRAPF